MASLREDFAEIKGDIAYIRGSIAGIHEKMGLLDLIAQKILGESLAPESYSTEIASHVGGSLTSFSSEPNPPVIIQEQETLASKDADQIVSHVGGYLRNIDPIMDQIQRSSEEEKPEREEIHTSKDTESVVVESRKGVDQILCLGQRVTTTEATAVAEEEEPREHNHKPKKKKKKKKKRKRWKKCLLKIWKFLVVNRRSRKKENISLNYGNEWSGFYSIKMKVTLQVEKEKQRKAKSDGYAYHVLDIMLMRRKLVTKKSKRKKRKVTNRNKKRTRLKEQFAVRHIAVEGQLESKAVLFVPKGALFDPFDTGKKPNNIKLDVRLLFMDSGQEIISENLGVVKGIVCYEGLPLNILKETVQQIKILKVIHKNIVKKSIELVLETAENNKAVENSSFFEKLKKKSYRVNYMMNANDEDDNGQLQKFEGKKLVSTTSESLKLVETEGETKKKEELKEKFEGTCKMVKDLLGDTVEKVSVPDPVVDSSCCVVTVNYGWTADIERNVKAQAWGDSSISGCMTNKKMEISLDNLIMGELRKRADADNPNKYVEDLAFLLFETALLNSDLSCDESNTLGSRIRRLFKPGLNINDEQMETRRVQMLQPVKQFSGLCVPTVPAAIQGEETCTKADMGQEHHGFDKAWQKGQEDSTLASDARLLLSLHHTLDCCSSYYVITIWTAFGSGKASWRTSFLSMTLRTRSVSKAPVMIRVVHQLTQ